MPILLENALEYVKQQLWSLKYNVFSLPLVDWALINQVQTYLVPDSNLTINSALIPVRLPLVECYYLPW